MWLLGLTHCASGIEQGPASAREEQGRDRPTKSEVDTNRIHENLEDRTPGRSGALGSVGRTQRMPSSLAGRESQYRTDLGTLLYNDTRLPSSSPSVFCRGVASNRVETHSSDRLEPSGSH